MSEVWDLGDTGLTELLVHINKETFILREASGEVGRQYKNAMLNRTEIDDKGKPKGLRDMGDIESILVSLCLYRRLQNGTEERVSVDEVRSWPNRIQTQLFNKTKEISGLDEDEGAKQEAKNG